ncbi:protein prenylyltransferase [Basidiobolus meristosporus CBS 931.73]|uniref:Protein prenylyltransferase n=1 Tax=Basidiobolus meristosporus CBS 931.73 TaxID=1314790 RepID=A0A1Y1Z3V2_9FUNG|nr:protein prenylyltransferase [Basidiobolus meristosporus CBS 931.73]|eukprot:ORY04929.1 protein prenylyltransferase [Basidiobolus meristosporus CBS 931.73]
MEYTPEVLYEKLTKILYRSEELEELGLLPVAGNLDGSEHAPFVLLENRLGIPLQYVTTIYKCAWGKFCSLRSAGSGSDKEALTRLDCCMKSLIIINPECYSAWNLRKQLVQQGQLDPANELPFIELLFTFPQHNKSYTTWHHRKWVIELIAAKTSCMPSVIKEIEICSRVGELYPKNYNAWVHRQWILKYIDNQQALLEELERVTYWNNSHISDHSGFHHREQVLLRICQQLGVLSSIGRVSRINIMEKSNSVSSNVSLLNASLDEQRPLLDLWLAEFRYTKELLTRYPEHETLWYHLRFCYFYWRLIGFEELSPDIEESNTAWPCLHSEMNFVEQFIELNAHDSDEATYALSYKLYILELNQQEVMPTMAQLAELSKHSNYYAAHLPASSRPT